MTCSLNVLNRKDADDFLQDGGIDILSSLIKSVN